MADITLRSYQEILGIMAAKLLADTDLTDLSQGSVLLTILEAAASSDFSIEGRLLQLLNLRNIDKTSGTDLEKLAFELGLTPARIGAEAASATLTVSDSAFTKVASNIYAGSNSPASGDTEIRLVDASGFLPSGTIYIARGTQTAESLAYVSKINTGSYWKLNLASPLSKDHLVGEEVVLSQGGNRKIPARTVVRVPSGAGATSISFNTLIDYFLLDGESSISGIAAVSTAPGSSGIVGRNKITDFVSKPWSTALVTNPDSSTGGRDPETDLELKQRIKDHVHNLGKGTERAIIRAVIGTSDPDEGKRVVSAFLREPTTSTQKGILFIDDGTGFAPTFSGIGQEVVVTSAKGTEDYFQLQKWPVVKAQATSIGVEPFNLSGGEQFYVEVDGKSEQRAVPANYRTPGVALAQEVAESINKTFTSVEARAKDGKLFITSISDDPDWIRVGAAPSGVDANVALRFPTNRAYTIRLYKNDILLEKNGSDALIQSLANSQWPVFGSSETLQLKIDGILSPVITFVDLDFATLTGSTTLLSATLGDWVTVINSKFIGITALARDDGTYTLQSNKGRISAASIGVVGGSLASKMFSSNISSQGREPDYALNRLLGTVQLTNKLKVLDELKAGTINTNGFVLTSPQAVFNTSAINSKLAEIVFVPDAQVSLLPTAQTFAQTFTTPQTAVQRMTGVAGQYSSIKADDWCHLYNMPRSGLLRVRAVATNGSYVDFFDPSSAAGVQTPDGVNSSIRFFRTLGLPQLCQLPDTNSLTGLVLASTVTSQILGVNATVTDTGAVRIATSRYASGGALGVPSVAGNAVNLGIVAGNYLSNDPHTASIESSDLSGIPSGRIVIQTDDVTLPYDNLVAVGTPFINASDSNGGILTYVGSAAGFIREPADRISTSQLTLRNELPTQQVGLGQDMKATKLSWMEFGQQDNMVMLIDNDAARKTFDIPMYVDATVSGTFVPNTTDLDLIDSTGALLGASSRWIGHRFEDYRAWFQARTTMPASAPNSQLKATAVPFGPTGIHFKFGYFYPTAPSTDSTAVFSTAHANASYAIDPAHDQVLIQLVLASGVERSLNLQPNKTVYIDASGAGAPYTQRVSFLYPVDLTSVLVGDVCSVQDPAFNTANRGEMRVKTISNLVDFSKSYQFINESVTGQVTGGNTVILDNNTAQNTRVGDKLQITGVKQQVQNVFNNSTTRTVSGVGVNQVIVSTDGPFKPANGSFKIGISTYTYTTYTSGTKTFAGVSPNPSGVVNVGDTLVQNNFTVVVPNGGLYNAGPSTFQSNSITFGYDSYSAGTFQYVTPDPTGIIVIGNYINQAIVGGGTSLITSVATQADFQVSPALTNASGYVFSLTHKALSCSGMTSFTVAPVDHVQVGALVLKVTSIIDAQTWDVDLPFAFAGLQPGIVSRLYVEGQRAVAGVTEAQSIGSNRGVRIYDLPALANKVVNLKKTINATAGVKDLLSLSDAPGSDGSGSVLTSTQDELMTGPTYVALKNGESFVYQTNTASPVIRLKEPTDEAPAIGEKVRLVPTTAENLYNHFSKKQVSGLTIAANVDLVGGGRKLQITSKTPGGLGQVYAVGGRASGLNVLKVRGTTQEISQYRAQIELDRSINDIVATGHTVRLFQPGRAKKKFTGTQPTPTTTVQIQKLNLTTGRMTFGVPLSSMYSYTHTGSVTWMVRKVGRSRMRYEVLSGTASVPLGLLADDWVLIGNGTTYSGVTPAQVFSSANQSWFQVRETDNLTYFDIENTGVEEFVSTTVAPFIFTPYHSARVGDQIVIGADTPVISDNQGTFLVSAIQSPTVIDYTNAKATDQAAVAIGSGVQTISLLDQGYVTYRKVVMVAPKPNDPTNRAQLIVSPGYDISLLNEGQGAKLTLPNRLGFGTDPVPGMSGYQFWTGLKRRAQRVVDGYEPDSATFEGTRASGAQIEVREPQIQRVSIALKLKTSKGVSLQSLSDTIKSAIDGYINSLGLGQDVILSECVSLVQAVPGVESVVMVYPSPTTERITINSNAIARISASEITLS